jgi:uncharacterized protein YwbE
MQLPARADIKPGLKVAIVLKRISAPAGSPQAWCRYLCSHLSCGIKVRLEAGEVGR